MTTAALTQDPISVGLKQADSEGRELFQTFVNRLNAELKYRGHGAIWWQPDSSKRYPHRWFWMFSRNSDARDFITRLNFVSRHAITTQISHFGARKPLPVEFVPGALFKRLVYPKKSPPEVRIASLREIDFFAPLMADHYLNIAHHIERGGKLKPRGWSHLEVALKGYLNFNDTGKWVGWYHPDFLGGRREIDIANHEERIAIEVQGSHWHKLEGIRERDEDKKAAILAEGWKLIWAWESAIRDRHGFSAVLRALKQSREGEPFVEIS